MFTTTRDMAYALCMGLVASFITATVVVADPPAVQCNSNCKQIRPAIISSGSCFVWTSTTCRYCDGTAVTACQSQFVYLPNCTITTVDDEFMYYPAEDAAYQPICMLPVNGSGEATTPGYDATTTASALLYTCAVQTP